MNGISCRSGASMVDLLDLTAGYVYEILDGGLD